MKICEYCKRKIGKNSTPETHLCVPKKQFLQYGKYDEKIKELVLSGHSLLNIANASENLLGERLTRTQVVSSCIRSNTPMPSIKDTAQSSVTRGLYKKTVTDRFGEGIINVSQSPIIKEKKIQVNLMRYGVENPFQREEIKSRSKKTMMEKYGVENPIELPKQHFTRLTKPHRVISEWLSSIGIEHENEVTGIFRKYNENLKRNYSPIPDIYVPSKRTIIEIYGDYWHMNPSIYKETDTVRFFDGHKTGLQVWEFDRIRIEHLSSFVDDVIVLWGSDIKLHLDKTKSLLLEKLCVK